MSIKFLKSTVLPFGILCMVFSNTLHAQLFPRQLVLEDLITQITPQSKKRTAGRYIELNQEMLEVLQYSRSNINPMRRDFRTDRFLDKYFPYYESHLLRNGDMAYLRFYYDKYLRTLETCLALANQESLEFGSDRKTFFKTSSLETRKEKRIFWRKFNEERNLLIIYFYQFRDYILPAISTEIALILQQEHFPELAVSMDNLTNLDGTALTVTVYSNRRLAIPKSDYVKIAGLSIISKCDNVFTSGSPAVRNSFPGLRGANKGLSVHLSLFESGITLSHELGHLYYLYHKWEEYVEYIKEKGKDYEPGGHGPDDPSGHAAKMTENGVLPF